MRRRGLEWLVALERLRHSRAPGLNAGMRSGPVAVLSQRLPRMIGLLARFGCIVALACGCSQRSTPAEQRAARPARAAPASKRAPNAPLDVDRPPPDADHDVNGVVSKLLVPGHGTLPPSRNDCVRVRYTSWRRDGSMHSATRADEPPETQCLQSALPGLLPALERMVEGEQRRVWLPGQLGYAARDSEKPAPHDDLTFDLTLVEVLRAPPAPPDLDRPPPTARRLRSGLRLQVIQAGTGRCRALPADRMRVRFTGWTRDGSIFESTELGGKVASVTRADLAPGVGEGLSLMQVGEKARLWVPAALAYGTRTRRGLRASDLTYDIELIAIERQSSHECRFGH